jgi:formate hydrogenlyase transcriptional activator
LKEDGLRRPLITVLLTEVERLAAYSELIRRTEQLPVVGTRAEFFELLSNELRGLPPGDGLTIWLHVPAHQMLRLALLEASAFTGAPPMTEAPVEFGSFGRVLQNQRSEAQSIGSGPAPFIVSFLREQGFRVYAVVPVSTPASRFGVLGVASRDVDRYGPELVATLERLGSRIAAGLEQCAAEAPQPIEVVQPANVTDRVQLLLRLTNAFTSHRHLPDLLQTISAELLRIIPHHYASLSLWDAVAKGLRRWAVVQPSGADALAEGELLDEREPPWLAFNSGDVYVLSRPVIDQHDSPMSKKLVSTGLRSGVCLPLKTPRAKYGALNVGSPKEDAFHAGEIMLLWQIARQLALAIENATYFDQAERYRLEASAQRDRFKLLLDINNALVSRLDPHDLWLSMLGTVRQAVDHDYANLLVIDAAAREVHVEAITYYDARGVVEPHTVARLDQSGVRAAVERNVPSVICGADLAQFDLTGMPSLASSGLQCLCSVPLSTGRGVIGALNLASRQADRFGPADIALLQDIAGQVAIAVENTIAFREISELKNRLTEEKLYLEAEISERHDFKEIIGASRALQDTLQQILAVAPTDASVLLLGETGTGKELLARAIHEHSRRRSRAFIRFNGASLPADLVESELFGYEKGAFTGASRSKPGRLELANHGTFFLDEVGDLPIEIQPKLLRVLQEREFERLGSAVTQHVDVRLIAATNRNLDEMVAAGLFRRDLFYRLSVFPVLVPPLRDRHGDIPALVRHFVDRSSRLTGRRITTIPRSTMEALERWHWPGNIRELQNVIERAVILSAGSELQIPFGALQPGPDRHERQAPAETRFQEGERQLIVRALRDSKGIIGGPDGAAARLGLKRTTLHSKMRKLGIARPSY